MNTQTTTTPGSQSPHPLGPEYRPLTLTDERSLETRSAWFEPQLSKRIIPQMSPIGLLILGIFLLGAIIAMYGVPLIALVAYFLWVQKQNAPIPALRPALMVEELMEAKQKAQNQAMVDCGVDETSWREALDSGRIVTIMEAQDAIYVGSHPFAAEVRIVTGGAMDNGLVQHETTWIASRGPSASEGAYVRSEDQQIPWRAVSRVRRTAEKLTIETVGGSSTSVSLDTAQSRESDQAVNLNDAGYITKFVPMFVEAAQKKVMST